MTARTLGVFLVVFLMFGIGVRADNLDLKLIEQGAPLVRELKARAHGNVGTLKFQVRVEGVAEPCTSAGTLSSNLADRLENLLVVSGQGEHPAVGVIHAAGEVAVARDAHASARTMAGRKALFAHPYPLAWGRTKVTADAFLTGEVEFSSDLRSAKVHIDAFDRTGTLARLMTFSVDTDRSMLADAGLAFQLDRKARQAKLSNRLDQAAAQAATQRRKELPTSPRFRSEFVQVTVLVDGKPQQMQPTRSGATVSEPRIGQAVTLRLKNLTTARLGVLVRVAGRNSLGEGVDEGGRSLRWLLEPEKEYTIRGYHVGENGMIVRPFKIPSGSPHAELTPETGEAVELEVFLPTEQEEPRRTVSLRGLSPAERADSGSWTFRELQSRLVRRGGLRKITPRTVIADELAPPVQEELNNATLAEFRRIQFEALR
jgi:hypothetical protein